MSHTPDGSDFRELRALATGLARRHQADILIYSGEITEPGDEAVALGTRERDGRPHCLLLLTTLGGSAVAAYRLARHPGTERTIGVSADGHARSVEVAEDYHDRPIAPDDVERLGALTDGQRPIAGPTDVLGQERAHRASTLALSVHYVVSVGRSRLWRNLRPARDAGERTSERV